MSAADVDAVRSVAAQTVHGEVATPLIEKLSRFKVRALALSVLWIAFFVACQLGIDLLQRDAVELARTGIQVEGTVQKVEGPSKRNRFKVTLTYYAGSKSHTTTVSLEAALGPKVGNQVTLAYAPGDPQRLVMVEGRVLGLPETGLLTPLSFSAFLGFPACLGAAWLWRERYRSVSRTGLREATATVRPGWLFPKIDVYFENDYKFLATRRSLRIAPKVRKAPVFVGGEGTDMIVIFPRGRFHKDTLYAVPVKEIEPDTD
ncbi:hypothetical protein GCM10027598_56790 [Amycolatopsis oliviviridis]|uniref:DUF3592 domain-containing protein n=1 Tax=Amycolatopsis oliviviridis TaxID=1471590 RepID=A0ABQ3LY32_9PSEU|nr:DUF3592 domain-containing protein [Amycolatopsis oliviviridis]GHH27729.1 hypothetical protein GCM10017790_57440 [Amycolatopsis oliviviridis]